MEPALSHDREVLRFITCGSVDDGKSTLIGRLLYDSKLIFDDQLLALERDSNRYGTTEGDLDFALLVDGLQAEREQGITIDVAYRFFTTPKRSFIVADTPGHVQYTRNMATGASTAQLAVILVDARKGLSEQTFRHSYICKLMGIRHFVLAINKMDLVGYAEDVFTAISATYLKFAETIGIAAVSIIPMSARFGENLFQQAQETMPWYDGPSLLQHLETVDVVSAQRDLPFRFPVQWVNRPNLDFRGLSGTVVSGQIALGDPIVVCGSGRQTEVERIVTADGDLPLAQAGDAVTLVLRDEVDAASGDMLADPQNRPDVTDQCAAHVLWMSDEPLLAGRSYMIRCGTRWSPANVSAIKYKINVNTLEHVAAKDLHLNEIGYVNLTMSTPIAVDPYAENRATGSFILVDRRSNATVAAGMIMFPLRRAANIHRETLAISKKERAIALGQTPRMLWFTGLSGSGKSTIARLVEAKLLSEGRHTYMLDGDNIRHGLNRDLGFTDADRVENIRRVGEVAKLFLDAGFIVLCAFISPFRAERDMVREMVEPGEFIEIFIDTPLAECEKRDPKGLYAKARKGNIKNFTGIDSPYEPPENAELIVSTTWQTAQDCADDVFNLLSK